MDDAAARARQAPSTQFIVERTMEPSEALARERKRVTIDTRELTNVLYGGPEKAARRLWLWEQVARDPEMRVDDMIFMTREQLYERAMSNDMAIFRLYSKLGVTDLQEQLMMKYQLCYPMPADVHVNMFTVTLETQCDDEQAKYWVPLAKSRKIIGAYAQTEIGHGTFLRGLETTATYVPETQEFIFHSPTPSSYKWWPGGLGRAATHCVLVARLLLGGKDYGPQTFVIQLRSMSDHALLPGVETGDIGPKMGYNSLDNGYLRLDHYRAPRSSMLARYARVTPEGAFVQPPHAKANYGTMVFIRAGIVDMAGLILAKAATIAVRYSCVRLQGEPRNGERYEPPVLDYQMQQHSLFGAVATAYALTFTGRFMMNIYNGFLAKRAGGDFSDLPEIHATSAGLKALCTSLTSAGIETCRLACGGHGYSHLSGLPQTYMDYVSQCTLEGENVVMYLQTARYLVRCVTDGAKDPSRLLPSMRYLAGLERLEGQKCAVRSPADWLQSAVQLTAFQERAARLVVHAARLVAASNGDLNAHAVDLVRAARAHGMLLLLRNFVEAVETAPASARAPLKLLCDFFALYHIEQDYGDFLLDGFVSSEQFGWAKQQSRALLATIRPNAVGFVDAFALTDFFLNSSLGRNDGDVYRDMYRRTKQYEPFNQRQTPPGFEKHLRPVLASKL